jgi:DNA invertase Pin-like site-specific DNA recombinase
MDVMREYAKCHEMQIIKEYSDEGKSGLNIQGRDALAQMIQDVVSGNINYSVILVYDVSRWGRFQDPDESAHYEFICRRAGIQVHYCAEQFANDGSPVSPSMSSASHPRQFGSTDNFICGAGGGAQPCLSCLVTEFYLTA